MQTSRRATRIARLRTRRQEIAARAKDADKRIAAQLRELRRTRRKRNGSARPGARSSSGPSCAAQTSRTDISLDWLDEQIQALTRPDDRALFGLDGSPSAGADADEAEPAAARPAPPITSRQKKLLAKLVEEHPGLAREFGVDPDEPGLEKLGKAKATSLIRAMLDRVNAKAPPEER